MFEYYQNILCVHGGWLYDGGDILTINNYRNLVRRGFIDIVRRGCRNTPALVRWESIPERFKSIIIDKYGDPYKITKKYRFRDYLEYDEDAYEFFRNHTLPSGDALPEKNQKEYLANAIILNAIHVIVTNSQAKRKALGAGRSKIWHKIAEIIPDLPKHTYPHSLPKNVRRLQDKYRNYRKEGYKALIHKGFCNDNSEKVNDAAKIWLVSRMGDQVAKVANMAQLLYEYNEMAKQKDWKPLKDEKTIYNFLNKEGVKHLWYGRRYGDAASKEKFAYQHTTMLPTMRDSLWYSDGTKLNYFYLDADGKVATCQVYEVMDAYSEVLLGFHVSKTEDYKAQYSAYKMAIQISGHRPYQIGFDGQGGHKKLKAGDFLTKLARLSIKTAPYNGKSKTIESAFGRFQSQFLKREWFFTGQNITAKKRESKANREFINANTKSLPTLEEVIEIYAQRRREWNEAPHPKTGIPRIEMYMESKNPSSPEVTMWDMVDFFWIMRDKPVTCTAQGVSFKEKKVEYQYMVYTDDQLPDVNWLRNNVDKKFHIKFDPDDMSIIYLYENTHLGLRFVTEARTKVQVHRGKQEQEAWENEYIQKVKKLNEDSRIEADKQMDEILEEHGALPEQKGLRSPGLLGVKSAKKKAVNDIGKIQKKESNKVFSIDNEDEDLDIFGMM